MTTRQIRIVERILTRLKFKQLRLLVAVGKHNNIQNAARELNVSQPAATKMIKDVELDFEVQLFTRTNRGVIPTLFGETLIHHGKLIIVQIENAAQDMDNLIEGNSGRVVVGTLLAASPRLLPAAIKAILEERPHISIKLLENANQVLMPALRSGEIDLVVGVLPTHRHRDELFQERLLDGKLVAVVGTNHPLANKKTVTFNALKGHRWILPPVETSLRRQIDQYFISQDQFIPKLAVESVSYLANRSLLQVQDFICFMPAHVASGDIEAGLLVALNWNIPFGEGPIGVTYRQNGQLSPAAIAMLETLREVSKNL